MRRYWWYGVAACVRYKAIAVPETEKVPQGIVFYVFIKMQPGQTVIQFRHR
jgi:hypothetical protein